MIRRLATAMLLTLALPVLGEATSRRVAVMDFVNSGKDPALEWMGPAVADTITTKLHAVRALQLIERTQLYKVLQEQKLALSDLVDPSQAVKLGKLLGAEQVVLGAYAVFGPSVRFSIRFVDVATGAIVATSQANALLDPQNPNALWTALDQLAQACIDSLNTRVAIVQGLPQPVPVPPAQKIEPSPEERSRLTRAPTHSLTALEVYGQAQAAYKRHQWPEAARLFERATALDPNYAAAWLQLGDLLRETGQYPDALRAYGKARQLYSTLGDERGLAWTLIGIGGVHRRQGRYAEAQDYFTQSLRITEKLADEPAIAWTLMGIGAVYYAQGRYAESLDSFRQSLRIEEKLGNEPMIAAALYNIGLEYTRLGRYAEALDYFTRSLRLREKVGDEPGLRFTLSGIGDVHFRQRRYAEALSYFSQSLQINEKLGDEQGIAWAFNDIGLVHEAQGSYREALPYLERAAEIAQRLGMAPAQRFVTNRDRVRARLR